jgi:hypothetical protein
MTWRRTVVVGWMPFLLVFLRRTKNFNFMDDPRVARNLNKPNHELNIKGCQNASLMFNKKPTKEISLTLKEMTLLKSKNVTRTSSRETSAMVANATSFKTICLPMENGETINVKYTEM